MAPVLLCPECGTKHPLDNITSESAFPCSGCGRTLKVPAQAREMTAAAAGGAPEAARPAPAPAPAPAAPPPAPAPQPTRVVSAGPPAAAAVGAAAIPVAPPLGEPQGIPSADLGRERLAAAPARPSTSASSSPVWVPPVWVRLLLWLVAVPLAFLVVFGLARAFGFLATNEITDIALANGFHRYWPIIRLLPFVALVTALFVTGGVYGIARLRAREQPSSGSSGSGGGTRPTTRRPPPRQSPRSRTGA